ncbi:40S ribosomal protein S29 [Cryptococcus depauperatus]
MGNRTNHSPSRGFSRFTLKWLFSLDYKFLFKKFPSPGLCISNDPNRKPLPKTISKWLTPTFGSPALGTMARALVSADSVLTKLVLFASGVLTFAVNASVRSRRSLVSRSTTKLSTMEFVIRRGLLGLYARDAMA